MILAHETGIKDINIDNKVHKCRRYAIKPSENPPQRSKNPVAGKIQ